MLDPVAYSRHQLAPWDIESAWSSVLPWMEHGDQQPWRASPGRGSTVTTNTQLNLLPQWRALVDQIEHHARLAWPRLSPEEFRDQAEDLYVSDMWCNYTDPGQPSCPVHTHINPLAACYYPEGKDSMGPLILAGQAVSIEPRDILIIFPGTTNHWVGVNQSQERRRVVACNISLRGVNNQVFAPLAQVMTRTPSFTAWA